MVSGATVQHEGPCAGSGIEWPLPGMSEPESKRSKVKSKKTLPLRMFPKFKGKKSAGMAKKTSPPAPPCPTTEEYDPVCGNDGQT